MKHRFYEEAELELISLEGADVIATSGDNDPDDSGNQDENTKYE